MRSSQARIISIEVTEKMQQAGICAYEKWAERVMDFNTPTPSDYLVEELVRSVFLTMHANASCTYAASRYQEGLDDND